MNAWSGQDGGVLLRGGGVKSLKKNEKPAKELARTERGLNSHEQTPKQSGN